MTTLTFKQGKTATIQKNEWLTFGKLERLIFILIVAHLVLFISILHGNSHLLLCCDLSTAFYSRGPQLPPQLHLPAAMSHPESTTRDVLAVLLLFDMATSSRNQRNDTDLGLHLPHRGGVTLGEIKQRGAKSTSQHSLAKTGR